MTSLSKWMNGTLFLNLVGARTYPPSSHHQTYPIAFLNYLQSRSELLQHLPTIISHAMPLRIAPALYRPATFRPNVSMSARRTLMTTPRMYLKEDENRSPEELESKKQEHLNKQKQGQGHWEEKLGSQSEANVTADNEHVKDHDNHMSKLQEETSKKGEKGEI